MNGWCNDNWYGTYLYDGETFSVLQPKKVYECSGSAHDTSTDDSISSSDGGDEFVTMVTITMIFGMLFILLILARSCNPLRTDWFRLIAVYLIGTLGVVVSLRLGPSQGGFNRVAGFGILVHNMAELFIIVHIWIGHRHVSALWIILYVWLIMALATFLPMAPLFLILMTQGAFCDWTLVYSFIYLGMWMDRKQTNDNKSAEDRQSMKCYGMIGIASASLHILSIQPLFFGFATTSSTLSGITVIFLVPTFILYTWFASAKRKPIVIATSKHAMVRMAHQRTLYLKSIASSSADHRRRYHNPMAGDEKEEESTLPSEMHTAESAGLILNVNDLSVGLLQRDSGFDDVVQEGLYHDKATRKTMKLIFMAAFLTSVANSLLIWFSPCYIDVTELVC